MGCLGVGLLQLGSTVGAYSYVTVSLNTVGPGGAVAGTPPEHLYFEFLWLGFAGSDSFIYQRWAFQWLRCILF